MNYIWHSTELGVVVNAQLPARLFWSCQPMRSQGFFYQPIREENYNPTKKLPVPKLQVLLNKVIKRFGPKKYFIFEVRLKTMWRSYSSDLDKSSG